ncbi:MFS transporter [uncultured Bacteroides sp.]|uniref:MFS transporter n=1 Tax=uncultured Bacteroides sp. TaxID=162156 RepID=UPI002AA75EBE|nr:MFS transporter [uncultured Bacteroides sp.]
MTQQKKNYALPIIMMILLFGMISFVTNLAAPMGVVVKGQFQASNFMGMLGNFANFAAYAFMGIPAGILLKKIGYKSTALIAIAVGFFGILVQFLSGTIGSFPVYLIGAFISGFSMCMLNTVVNPMLNTLGGGGKKGNQLIQIGGTFNSLMATLVPVLVGILVGQVTRETAITNVNPVLFIAMGIFATVGIVLFFVQIPEPHIKKASSIKYEHSPWAFRHFILGTVAIFVYVGIEVGVPGTMNLFLTDPQGFGGSAAEAGLVTGTYWFLMLIGRFLGASFGAKISSKAMLTFASSLAVLLVLGAIFLPTTTLIDMPVFKSDLSFGMAQVPINAMLLVLVGLCTSIMWGGIFNLAVEGLGKYTEAATGIFMVMVCGGGILPLIQNYVADVANFMSSYWVIIAALAFLLYYAISGCKNVNKDIPVE